MNLDKKTIYAIQKLRRPWLDVVFKCITYTGELGIAWSTIAVILFLFAKTRDIGVELAIALLECTVVGEWLLKPTIKRNRPFVDDPSVKLVLKKARDYSHPSGHSSSWFAAATVFFCLDWRVGVVLYVGAALVAFSRVYLFMHYPSDVVGGAAWGIVFGFIAVGFYYWLSLRIGPIAIFGWAGFATFSRAFETNFANALFNSLLLY